MTRLSDLHRDWLLAQLQAQRRPSPANVRRANRALGRLVGMLWSGECGGGGRCPAKTPPW